MLSILGQNLASEKIGLKYYNTAKKYNTSNFELDMEAPVVWDNTLQATVSSVCALPVMVAEKKPANQRRMSVSDSGKHILDLILPNQPHL